MSPASTDQAKPQPEPKMLLSEVKATHEPPAKTSNDQNTQPVLTMGLLGVLQEPAAKASPDSTPEPKSLLPEALTTAPEPLSQKPDKQLLAAPSPNANQTKIRIERSSLTFKTPSQTSGSGNTSLQTALVSAITGQKITIITQLLDRGVTCPEKPKNGLVEAVKRSSSETALPILKLLLEYGADPNLSSPDTATTPLWYAIREENASMFRLLLEFGADPNAQMGNGSTAFIYACERDSVPFKYVSKMLLYSADPNVRSRRSDSGLYTACVKNKPELVKFLLENGADPDLKGPELPIQGALKYPTCLELLLKAGADLKKKKGIVEVAVSQNQIESVKLLLDAGAGINEKYSDLFTPLTTAIREKRVEILALLIKRGVDLHLKGQDYPLFMATKTPSILRQLLDAGADPAKAVGVMEMAVHYNQIESVRILLDAGVSPNDKRDKIFTPLTTAIREKRSEILALLLKRGADPNLKGQDIPLVMAVKDTEILKQLIEGGADVKGCKGIVEAAVAKKSTPAIDVLLDAGAGINEKRMDVYTALATAVRENSIPIISHLLKRGADPNVASSTGLPVVMAAGMPDQTRLKMLLEAGADVNVQFQGKSALMEACEKGMRDNVRLLIERGADVNLVNFAGKSAMDIAAGKGHDDIVMTLLEAM
jgi:ankyrin repeat protein